MARITPIFLDRTQPLVPADDGIALAWADVADSPELTMLLAMVKRHFRTSAAFISVLGREFQWFLASDGIDPVVAVHDHSVCRSVIYDRSLATLPDLSADALLADNPFVAGDGRLRAYAGVRLKVGGGRDCGDAGNIGAFCIGDRTPRRFSKGELDQLRDFSAIAAALIAARVAQAAAAAVSSRYRQLVENADRKDRLFRQTERMIDMGSWRMNLATQAIEWSPGVFAIHALSADEPPPLNGALAFYSPADQAILSSAIASCSLDGTPFDLELDFTAADGKRKRVRALGELEHGDGRPLALIGMCQDVSARFRLETVLRGQATTDPLTGLANRTALQQQLAAAYAEHPRPGSIAVLLIDLDGFKMVNDRLGHARGDEILTMVAERLKTNVTDGSLIARYGGDEFVVVVTGQHAAFRASGHVAAFTQLLWFEIDSDHGPIMVSASVGFAVNAYGENPTDLLRQADDAMYRRKAKRRAAGGNRAD